MGGYEVIAPSAPFSVYNKRRIATGIKTIIGPLRKKKKKKKKKKTYRRTPTYPPGLWQDKDGWVMGSDEVSRSPPNTAGPLCKGCFSAT